MFEEISFSPDNSEKAAKKARPNPHPEKVNCPGCEGQYHTGAVVYCTESIK